MRVLFSMTQSFISNHLDTQTCERPRTHAFTLDSRGVIVTVAEIRKPFKQRETLTRLICAAYWEICRSRIRREREWGRKKETREGEEAIEDDNERGWKLEKIKQRCDENTEKISFFLFSPQCKCHFRSLVLSARARYIFLLLSTAQHGNQNTDASTHPKIIAVFFFDASSSWKSRRKASLLCCPSVTFTSLSFTFQHVCFCWLQF